MYLCNGIFKAMLSTSTKILIKITCLEVGSFIYLIGVLRRFQHCTGHITTGSWKGRGNQYIEFASSAVTS